MPFAAYTFTAPPWRKTRLFSTKVPFINVISNRHSLMARGGYGERLSCFIQFHYSIWGGVSVLTLQCQHDTHCSCTGLWLRHDVSLKHLSQVESKALQMPVTRSGFLFPPPTHFQALFKWQLNSWLTHCMQKKKEKQNARFSVPKFNTPSLAICGWWNMWLFMVAATVLRVRPSEPGDNNSIVQCC